LIVVNGTVETDWAGLIVIRHSFRLAACVIPIRESNASSIA
jgi:hypothetical protein